MQLTDQRFPAGFAFPAKPRRRRWPRRPRAEQLPLRLGETSLLEWVPEIAPVIPLRPRRLKAAEDPTIPRREQDWKPPPEQRALFTEWEKLLAREGMPAELPGDAYARIPDETMQYLAAPGGGVRPTLAARHRDSEGQRLEHGTSRGAWWHGEVDPDEAGADRWRDMADDVRSFVDGAIDASLRCAPGALLTAPQASVLRRWFEGSSQTEIARQEGHSKVTVHHKLHRAIARIVDAMRASRFGQAS